MAFWVIAGFGFLLSMRAIRRSVGEPATGLSIYGLWRGFLDLLVSAFLLVTAYSFAEAWAGPATWFGEWNVLGVWCSAYLIGKCQRKPDLFFIVLVVLTFGIAALHRDWIVRISFAAVTVSGIFFFQAFFQGLKYALRFTRVPDAVKGWPAFCLLAFSITLALAGAARLIF